MLLVLVESGRLNFSPGIELDPRSIWIEVLSIINSTSNEYYQYLASHYVYHNTIIYHPVYWADSFLEYVDVTGVMIQRYRIKIIEHNPYK